MPAQEGFRLFWRGSFFFALDVVFGLPPFFPFLSPCHCSNKLPIIYMVIFYVLGMSLLGATGMDLVLPMKKGRGLRRKGQKGL